MNYGFCYQGSKNAIAAEIVAALPSGEVFVDLFCGGCAVTHAAILSGKYGRFVINDWNPLSPKLFLDAIGGKYANETRWISREDFERLKDTDGYVKWCWSFGGGGTNYLYSKEIEPYKRALHWAKVFGDWSLFGEMGIEKKDFANGGEVMRKYGAWYLRNVLKASEGDIEKAMSAEKREAESESERLRQYLRDALAKSGLSAADVDRHLGTNGMAGHYFGKSQWEFPTFEAYEKLREILPLEKSWFECSNFLQSLQNFERLQSLQNLQRLGARIEAHGGDYRQVEIPKNSVVYCDIPYFNTGGYEDMIEAQGGFDYAAFYDFAEKTPNCFVSEYFMPRDRFKTIWAREKTVLMCATDNRTKKIERLFVPKSSSYNGGLLFDAEELERIGFFGGLAV